MWKKEHPETLKEYRLLDYDLSVIQLGVRSSLPSRFSLAYAYVVRTQLPDSDSPVLCTLVGLFKHARSVLPSEPMLHVSFLLSLNPFSGAIRTVKVVQAPIVCTSTPAACVLSAMDFARSAAQPRSADW